MKARHSSICAVALLVAAIALSGCSSKKLQPAFEPVYDDPYSFEAYLENRKKANRSSMSQEERFAYDNRTASLSTMRESGIPLPNLHLIEQAKTALGTPYVPGGTDTQGFDCSGFVQWAYRNVGVTLPRTAREQSVMGRPIKSGSMMAGDIVALHRTIPGAATIRASISAAARSSTAPDAAKAYPSPPCPIPISAPPSSVPAKSSPRNPTPKPSKSSWHWTPANPPAPTRPPLLRVKSAPLRETNVRSGSRTPDTGRYPPQGVSPARKTGRTTPEKQKKRQATRCRPETDKRQLTSEQPKPQRNMPKKEAPRETGHPNPKYQKGCRTRKKHPGFGTGQGQSRTRQGGEGGQGGTARRREKSSSGQG